MPITLSPKVQISLTGISLAAAVFMYLKYKNSAKNQTQKGTKANLPPGPPPSDEKLGNLGDAAKYGSLSEYLVHLHTEYDSDVVTFWYGDTQCCSISSAQAFKQTKNLFDRPPLIFKMVESFITPRSIQYANGEEGQFRRKTYDGSFSHEACLNMIPNLNEAGEAFMERVLAYEGKSFDVLGELKMTAIESITRAAFGDFFKNKNNLTQMVELYDILWYDLEKRLYEGHPEPGSEQDLIFNQALDRLHILIKELVADRKQRYINGSQDQPKQFIDVLLETWGDDDEKIFADTITYMVGGFHTTAASLTWSLYHCCLNPQIQEKLAAEALEVIGKENLSNINDAHIAALKYHKQVFHEVLRLSVVGTVAARFNPDNDMTINNYCIPAGMPILQSFHASFKDAKVWPNPEKFDPERFNDENADLWNSGFAYQPFGFAGKRKCPGYRFAYMEAQMWLAKWMGKGLRFEIDEKASGPVEPSYGLVTTPKNTLYLSAKLVN